MEIRRANEGDLDAALAVWARARVTAGSPPSTQRIERVRAKLADPGALVVVARIGDALVAMALLEAHRSVPEAGHVSMVFVDPLHQGEGVGQVLMRTAHVLAERQGWRSTSLWTRESNTPAQALYRSVGYLPIAETGRTPAGDLTRRWLRDLRSAADQG